MFQAPITNLPELVEKYIKESLELTISEPLALTGDQVNVNEDYAIVPVRVENTGTLTLTNLRFFITAPDSNIESDVMSTCHGIVGTVIFSIVISAAFAYFVYTHVQATDIQGYLLYRPR